MKVLFLSIVPSPYQRDLFACLNRIDGIDIEVHYAEAGSPDSPWPKDELADYEKVYRSFYISWRGKRFIVNSQVPNIKGFDAVVLNGYVTLPAQWVLRTAGKKVPLLFWGEKLEHAQGGLREIVQKRLTSPIRRLSAIVAIGKKAKRDYAATFPEVPVYEVPYYCRISNFQNVIPERPRKPVQILFCGQMIKRKGVDLLLQAFSELIQEGLDTRLILVGREAELPGMLAGIPEETRRHIDFKGFQAPSDLPKFYTDADIFVLPSRYDGWGVVVNQAMGAGLPIICSEAVGAAEDLVRIGENGYIFSNENTGQLKAALKELICSPDKLGQYARNSLELSSEITPERGAERWLEILKEVTGR